MYYFKVPREGLEPTPPCGERILSPPRLPFRHLGKELIEWRRRADLNRCIGVLQTPALTTWLRRLRFSWSGRRDSNSRLPPWQGGVLPLNYFRTPSIISKIKWCRGGDLNSYGLTPTTPSRWRVYQVPPPRHQPSTNIIIYM